jgi:uroporphyrinogen-III decarboxylase
MGIITTLFRPFILRAKLLEIFEYWHTRNVPWWGITRIDTPIEILSYMRGFKFLTDIHRRPDKIKQVCDMIIDGLIAGGLINARAHRKYSNMVMIQCHRGGNTYFSPRIFGELYFPYLRKMVNSFTDEGFNVFLHLDSSYDLNLEYFRELPKRRVVLELDGTTDIVKTKRVLGDYLCVKGDVPATLLALGSPREVEKYCKKLIDVVGEGGGFILSDGCEIPINASFENVKTLLDTAKTYGVYRK